MLIQKMMPLWTFLCPLALRFLLEEPLLSMELLKSSSSHVDFLEVGRVDPSGQWSQVSMCEDTSKVWWVDLGSWVRFDNETQAYASRRTRCDTTRVTETWSFVLWIRLSVEQIDRL